MNRPRVSVALAVTLAACTADLGPPDQSRVSLSPVLDSMFVGEGVPPRRVTYYDKSGAPADPGIVQWSSSDTAILDVDSSTGHVTGKNAGLALVLAIAHNTLGSALIAVSKPLQVTLLQDSVYLMPGDTFTAPVEVTHQAAGDPTVWFSAAPNPVFDVDSATGRATAKAVGGPVPFIAHAVLGTDSVEDSGSVQVVQLTDTVGGRASYTVFGTVNRTRTMPARALNFHRRGDTLTFRLRAAVQASTTAELVAITLRTAPTAPGSFAVDSISLAEASTKQYDPYCRPPRSWGTWSITTSRSNLVALSRAGGHLTITRMVPIANGMAISGRFYLPAQRTDLYDDPLGALPIRGTFVAPLITTTPRCE